MKKLKENSVFLKISTGLDWISKPFMIGTFIESDIKKTSAKMETNLHRIFDWFIFLKLRRRSTIPEVQEVKIFQLSADMSAGFCHTESKR